MSKITEYTELTTVAGSDVLIIVDDPGGTPVTKKITVSNLLAGIGFDVSTIAKGGLLVGSAAGTISILTVGSDGQVLTVQSDGSLAWGDGGASDFDALELKASVKAATTANITLSGEQTIDGVSCAAGDRVLVKDQTDATENGIYVVNEYAWVRADDMEAGSSAAAAFGHIQQGTANADQKFLCTDNTGGAVVGTDELTFAVGGGGGDCFADGSEAEPSITFCDDPDTGFYRKADNTIGVALEGANVASFESGFLVVGTTGTGDAVYINGVHSAVSARSISFGEEYDNESSGSSKSIAWSNGNAQSITLTDDCTLTFGQLGGNVHNAGLLVLRVIQDETGGHSITWPASVKCAGGTMPSVTSGAGAEDLFFFYCDGNDSNTFYLVEHQADFS